MVAVHQGRPEAELGPHLPVLVIGLPRTGQLCVSHVKFHAPFTQSEVGTFHSSEERFFQEVTYTPASCDS